MSNWFRAKRVVNDPVAGPVAVDPNRPAILAPAAGAADLEAAYERGHKQGRRHRPSSPLLTLIVLMVVLLAGAFVALSIRNGSLSSGGAVVDNGLDQAARTVDAPIKGAAETTGDALKSAGQSLK